MNNPGVYQNGYLLGPSHNSCSQSSRRTHAHRLNVGCLISTLSKQRVVKERTPSERVALLFRMCAHPGSGNRDAVSNKPEEEIQAEIRSILKQIVSSVTFLPIIDEPTVFNILAYTSQSAEVPADEWVDSDPLAIEAGKSQQVKLRSFSTDVHRIEAMVAYRYDEES